MTLNHLLKALGSGLVSLYFSGNLGLLQGFGIGPVIAILAPTGRGGHASPAPTRFLSDMVCCRG